MFGPSNSLKLPVRISAVGTFCCDSVVVVVLVHSCPTRKKSFLRSLIEVAGNVDGTIHVPAELVVAESLPFEACELLRAQVLALSALLRKYSKALPWKSLVPLLGIMRI